MTWRILESVGIVLAALVLFPLVLMFVVKFRSRINFDYAMRHVAQRAVIRARKERGLKLDYSAASIEQVERVLSELHVQHAQTSIASREFSMLSLSWGAYIGEVMKRVQPGRWQRDSEKAGAGSMPLVFDSSNEAFPCSWAYKRIADGPDDNILFKFQVFSDPRFRESLVGSAIDKSR